MPSRRSALALLCVALLSTLASHAAPPVAEGFDVRTFTCPVGGATFTQDVGYSSLVLVQFADGSWLGDTGIDAQIPECPDNGLVLLPDYEASEASRRMAHLAYTPAQLARLPDLIASDAYRDLRKHNRHERAQWLATQLGLPAALRWQLLLRGSWATVDAAERKRFVTRIAEEGPALVDAMDAPDMEKRRQRLLIANALRELGRFDDAHSLLEAIFASLPADADIKDPDSLSVLGSIAAGLEDAITHRDDDRFPITMSSTKWVSGACQGNTLPPPYGPETANAKAACERRARERQARDDAFDEALRLQESPEALDRQCAATPDDKRSPGLQEACRQAQSERDQDAGQTLALEQPDKLAMDCEATPALERKGALFYGCITYRTMLESALSKQLVDDDEAYAIICVDGRQPPDRAGFATMACSSAERERAEEKTGRTDTDDDARETTPTQVPDTPEKRLYAPDSGLRKAARAGAARVIAKAKSERTYPKRQRGDLY